MTAAWPQVPLGEVTSPAQRLECPEPGKPYRQIGVRLWGEGAYEREELDGGRTKYKTLNRVEAGDVIVNKIWARNGSVAVVPDTLAGCYCSGEFPTFTPVKNRLEPMWVHWITKTRGFWEQCDEKSRGTSGKNRIRPERFLEVTIPLPPLPEQRRIVSRIEELAGKVKEATCVTQAVTDEYDALCRSLVFGEEESTLTPMAELVELRPPDVSVEPEQEYEFAGVYCFGRGVFRGNKKKGMEFSYRQLTRIHAGEFVYPKLMAWEGALAVVPPELDGLYVSPEFPVFSVKQDKALPDVLDVYFRTPSVWPSLGGASTGTNVRRRRLNPQSFLRYMLPLPPMRRQLQLLSVRSRQDELKRLQAETQKELDALLPSILDRAFKGEL